LVSLKFATTPKPKRLSPLSTARISSVALWWSTKPVRSVKVVAEEAAVDVAVTAAEAVVVAAVVTAAEAVVVAVVVEAVVAAEGTAAEAVAAIATAKFPL
jgi:hypothetical protein